LKFGAKVRVNKLPFFLLGCPNEVDSFLLKVDDEVSQAGQTCLGEAIMVADSIFTCITSNLLISKLSSLGHEAFLTTLTEQIRFCSQ
jgi:hypothetical protein